MSSKNENSEPESNEEDSGKGSNQDENPDAAGSGNQKTDTAKSSDQSAATPARGESRSSTSNPGRGNLGSSAKLLRKMKPTPGVSPLASSPGDEGASDLNKEAKARKWGDEGGKTLTFPSVENKNSQHILKVEEFINNCEKEVQNNRKRPIGYNTGIIQIPKKDRILVQLDGKDTIVVHRTVGLVKETPRPTWSASRANHIEDLESSALQSMAGIRNKVSDENIINRLVSEGIVIRSDAGTLFYLNGVGRNAKLTEAKNKLALATSERNRLYTVALNKWRDIERDPETKTPPKPKEPTLSFTVASYLEKLENATEDAYKAAGRMLQSSIPYKDVEDVVETTAIAGLRSQIALPDLQDLTLLEAKAFIRGSMLNSFPIGLGSSERIP